MVRASSTDLSIAQYTMCAELGITSICMVCARIQYNTLYTVFAYRSSTQCIVHATGTDPSAAFCTVVHS